MRTQYLAILAASFTLAACASSRAPTGPVVYSQSEAADSVRLRVGQTALVGGIRLRFNAVESDSRCPTDAVCVWEGDAVANLTLELNCECRAAAYEFRLHTALEPKAGVAYGYRVKLLTITPAPSTTSPIKPDAYSAWLRIVPVEG